MAEDVQAVAEPAYPWTPGGALIYGKFPRRTQKMPVWRPRGRGYWATPRPSPQWARNTGPDRIALLQARQSLKFVV
jgi:hypothetical protein